MSEAASKARPHGDMPDALRDYWAHGEGAAKINWGAPDDFYRCRAALGEVVAKHPGSIKPEQINGMCENLHEIATGMSTAEHAALLHGKGKDHPTTAAEKINARIQGRE